MVSWEIKKSERTWDAGNCDVERGTYSVTHNLGFIKEKDLLAEGKERSDVSNSAIGYTGSLRMTFREKLSGSEGSSA